MTNESYRLPSSKILFRHLLTTGILIVFWAASARISLAQVMVAGAEPTENNNPGQAPFLLPAQPTEIGEAMEDFRRFAGRKQWEKAFKHLEKVFASTNEGLVLTADGIMLPSRLIAREALLERAEPAYRDSYSFVDPDESDYARLLQLINEFLPVKEMAGKVIGAAVLRQFGLIENDKVDSFLATIFSKSPKSVESAPDIKSRPRVQRSERARARQIRG